jgi:AAA domain
VTDDPDAAPDDEPKPKSRKKPTVERWLPNQVGDHVFRQVGVGYRLEMPSIATTLFLDHVKRSSDEVKADLTIKTRWPGSRVFQDDVLHSSRLNISSATTRKTVAGIIAGRVFGGKEVELDWHGRVEELCTLALAAERDAEPIVKINGSEAATPSQLLLKPFLPIGMPTVLFADGMSSKSTIATAIAITVSSGHPVIPGLAPRKTGPVLYLDWETDAGVIDARHKQLCAGAGIEPQQFYYRRCRRPLSDIAEEVARFVDAHGVILTIVDSMTMAIGSQAQGADAADGTLRFYAALAQIGGTALCIDHVPKNGDPTKPYGSVYRSNLARATWSAKRQGDENEGRTIHVVLEHTKHNTTRKMAPVGLRIDWDDDEETEIARSVRITQEPIMGVPQHPAPDDPRGTADRVADFLADEGGGPLTVNYISKALGADYSTVSKALNRNKDLFLSTQDGWLLRRK